MNPLEKFERVIGKVLRPPAGQTREPVELRREVLRDIADQVQPAGNGEYLFPYTAVRVELYAADEAQQGPLEAIFTMPGFADDVNATITDRGAYGLGVMAEFAGRRALRVETRRPYGGGDAGAADPHSRRDRAGRL